MKINVNEYVSVKLNDYGRDLTRRNHDKLWAGDTRFPYKAPKEDLEGYSRWSIWHLMQEFGPYVGCGFTVPFDTDIVYEHNDTN